MERNDYVVVVGRPSYQKNTLFLTDIVRCVHKMDAGITFKLLGVGYYSPELEQVKDRIRAYGLEDTIELLPWLSHDETMAYMKGAVLYLTVSRYEGLPLSVVEAMSLGKAIVASDTVGNSDCVQDGVNGRLLPFEAQRFADAICELAADAGMRRAYGQGSRRIFEERFLITNRIKELERMYGMQHLGGVNTASS